MAQNIIDTKKDRVVNIVKARAEGSSYIGAGDNLLDFGGAGSFLQEDRCGKIFSMNITNSSSDDCKIALFPGNFVSGDAYLDEANLICEGEVATDVTAAGTPEKISAFLAYLKANPTRLYGIKIKVDDEAQLDEPIIFRHVNPFKGMVDQKRIPAQYQASADNNTKVITLTDVNDWLLGPNNIILTTLRAGRTAVITFVFGASLDCEMGLMNKAKEAIQNAQNMGLSV